MRTTRCITLTAWRTLSAATVFTVLAIAGVLAVATDRASAATTSVDITYTRVVTCSDNRHRATLRTTFRYADIAGGPMVRVAKAEIIKQEWNILGKWVTLDWINYASFFAEVDGKIYQKQIAVDPNPTYSWPPALGWNNAAGHVVAVEYEFTQISPSVPVCWATHDDSQDGYLD